MELIEIIENIKNGVQYTIRFKFTVPIPVEFDAVPNKEEVLNSWKVKYPAIDSMIDGHIIFIDSEKVDYESTELQIKEMLSGKFQYFKAVLAAIPIVAGDSLIGQSFEPIITP